MNIGNTIKPSDIKKWDVVKHEPKNHSRATKELKNPDHYGYYQSEGQWFPHRLPTISEILKDTFI